MNIKITSWRGPRVVPLEEACTPHTDPVGGWIENTKAQAELNAEVLGRLIAWMVVRDEMSLEEAQQIVGDCEDWEKVDE